MFAMISIQMYGLICKYYGYVPVLNPTWFEISWWIMIAQAVICGVIMFPFALGENDNDEIRGMLRDFGMKHINRFIHCWPFLLLVLAFVQFNGLWQALMTIPVYLCHLSICYCHSQCLEKFLNAEAQQGTDKS